MDFKFLLPARPLEKYRNVDVTYGSVVTKYGDEVRTLFSRPKISQLKLPAILIVQWLSCDQVEIRTDKVSVYDSLLYQLIAETGYAVMRVEKPGLGDSGGPDCTECDYETEIAAYEAAMSELKKNEHVDTNAIYVFGISIGASTAPLLFSRQNIKGMILSGGISKTWLEHMLELERKRLPLSGVKPEEVNSMMRKYSEFYDEYLNREKLPGTVIKERPHLQGIWYDGYAHQYERPAAYYHQLQSKNVAQALSYIRYPVLVVYGQFDWIMSRQDHEEMVSIVNSDGKRLATFREIPTMSHNFTLHQTLQSSFSGTHPKYASEVFRIITRWIAEQQTKTQ